MARHNASAAIQASIKLNREAVGSAAGTAGRASTRLGAACGTVRLRSGGLEDAGRLRRRGATTLLLFTSLELAATGPSAVQIKVDGGEEENKP